MLQLPSSCLFTAKKHPEEQEEGGWGTVLTTAHDTVPALWHL